MAGVSNDLSVAGLFAFAAAAAVLWGFLGAVMLKLAREDRRVSRSAHGDNLECAGTTDVWGRAIAPSRPERIRSRPERRDCDCCDTCHPGSEHSARTDVRDHAVYRAGVAALRGPA